MLRHDRPKMVTSPVSRLLFSHYMQHDDYVESVTENETRLHALCVDGSMDEIEHLLLQTNSAHVNSMNENGLTPLHVAIHRSGPSTPDVLELLARLGSDLDARTLFDGDTALHLAVRNIEAADAEPIIVKLRQLGADIAACNENRRTAADEAQLLRHRFMADVLSGKISVDRAVQLQRKRAVMHRGERFVNAICDGNEELMNSLMDDDIINYVSMNGSAAIHYVITRCPISKSTVLTSLISRGADVNLVNYECDTALNLVIKSTLLRSDGSMLELADILLQAGAQLDIKDLDGHDAMALARSRQYDDVIQLLEEYLPEGRRAKITAALFDAVTRGGFDEVKEAVQTPGADVNAFNKLGMTPVHVVTLRNDVTDDVKLAMLSCLLSNGADVNAICQSDGNSMLHLLAMTSSPGIARSSGLKVVKLLIDNGIDPAIRNKAGETAYLMAVRLGVKDKDLKKAFAAGLIKSSTCLVS